VVADAPQAQRIMLGRLAGLEAKMAIARRLAEIEEGQEAPPALKSSQGNSFR